MTVSTINARSSQVVARKHEYGLAVIEMSDDEAERLKREAGPELIVAPAAKYSVGRVPTFPSHARQNESIRPVIGGPQRSVIFKVVDAVGNPVPEARIVAFFSLPRARRSRALSRSSTSIRNTHSGQPTSWGAR